ncbi:unnamed protein product, partial [marine sediment metagenome]
MTVISDKLNEFSKLGDEELWQMAQALAAQGIPAPEGIGQGATPAQVTAQPTPTQATGVPGLAPGGPMGQQLAQPQANTPLPPGLTGNVPGLPPVPPPPLPSKEPIDLGRLGAALATYKPGAGIPPPPRAVGGMGAIGRHTPAQALIPLLYPQPGQPITQVPGLGELLR